MQRTKPIEENAADAIVCPRFPVVKFICWLHRCWQRERERRELAALGSRDFGDLVVPPSLVADELRRWPVQEASPQWGEIVANKRGCDNAEGRDRRRIMRSTEPRVRDRFAHESSAAQPEGIPWVLF